MSFPRYPKYKPSGVEWLGDVPEHWSVTPLKHLADFINGDAFKPTEWAESGIPIIRIQNLNGSEEFNYFDGHVEPRYLVHDGDLLFGWSGNRGTSFGPFIWRKAGVCALNQHIFRVVTRAADQQALFWTLKAVTAHVEDQAHGIIGMVHITKGDLGAIKVPIPDTSEQSAIAGFLDRETSKIDGLVGEQRRLIELLKEKRQAVISHAVTKGLNPQAPLKPSGIQWLGDVPEHWAVGKSRFYLSILSGFAFPSADFSHEETDVRLLRGINVGVSRLRWDEVVYWRREAGDGLDIYEMNEGDIVIGMDRPLISEGMRVAKVRDTDLPCLLLQRVASVKTGPDLLADYYLQLLSSEMFVAHFSPETTGVSVPHISPEQISDFVIPIPPFSEQTEIVAFLDAETAKLDALTAEAERAIELLQERRTALISAAVTGKIDVRNFTPTEAA